MPPSGEQCWTCSLIVGVYEAKQEVELDTLTKPRDNPFKFGSGSKVDQENHESLTGQVRPRERGNSSKICSSIRKRTLKAALRKGQVSLVCRKKRLTR